MTCWKPTDTFVKLPTFYDNYKLSTIGKFGILENNKCCQLTQIRDGKLQQLGNLDGKKLGRHK